MIKEHGTWGGSVVCPYNLGMARVPEAWQKAHAWLEHHRQQGHVIVFTNGCFDLLHPGHLHLLEQAKTFGDVLIVGLNTDASVRRLKGPDRPIFPLHDRMQILLALKPVDYVVPFEEDTPYDLIAYLQPDILVKGGDYTPDQVVGADLVRQWGGDVRIVSYLEGYSTTALLQKIRSKNL